MTIHAHCLTYGAHYLTICADLTIECSRGNMEPRIRAGLLVNFRPTVEALRFPPHRISPPLHVCRGSAKRSRLDHQPLLQAGTYSPAGLAPRLASARTFRSAIYTGGESGLLRADSTLEDQGAQSGRTLPHGSPPAGISTDGFQLVSTTGLIYIPELFAISKTYCKIG